jgi:CubicO group peptidase (beta-lactamase class C family)
MNVAHELHSHAADTQGWRGGASSQVAESLERGIREGIIRGGIVLASRFGKYTVQMCKGTKPSVKPGAEGKPVSFDTVFDLGTLTEVVCTGTLMMRLISAGKVGLNDRASRYIQSLGVGQKSHITVAHLLAHRSGFPVSSGIFDELVRANQGARPGVMQSSGAKEYAYKHLRNVPLKYAPGTKYLRSDIDYILLGEICEVVTGLPLEKAYSRFVAAPMDLRSLNFIDLTTLKQRGLSPDSEIFASMGECTKRKRHLCGEVWDDTTWAMGGVSGHNGLFGTVTDLHAWGHGIAGALHGRSAMCGSEVVKSFLTPHLDESNAEWRFGFEGLTKDNGAGALKVSAESVVVTSATGCSVMIEPKRDLVAVIVTTGGGNASVAKKVSAMRAAIHSAVLEAD